MPGPPPKHPSQRRRTNPTIALIQLPAEGRKGAVPEWPLVADILSVAQLEAAEAKLDALQSERRSVLDEGGATGQIDRRIDTVMVRISVLTRQIDAQAELEAALWSDLWRLPQAVEWERLGWLRDVAQYARFKVRGELGDLDAAKEARMWSDRLGLNPMAMLRLRWEVVRDQVAQKRDEKAADAPSTGSGARGRLRIVDGTSSAVAGS